MASQVDTSMYLFFNKLRLTAPSPLCQNDPMVTPTSPEYEARELPDFHRGDLATKTHICGACTRRISRHKPDKDKAQRLKQYAAWQAAMLELGWPVEILRKMMELSRECVSDLTEDESSTPVPPMPEPEPERRLRAYPNYTGPRLQNEDEDEGEIK